jgi:hypothetical protein
MSMKVPFPTCKMAIVDHPEFANVNRIAEWGVCTNNSTLPHSPHPAEKMKNQKEKERATTGYTVFRPDPRISPLIQHSAAYIPLLQPLPQKYGVWIDMCIMESE